jgi:4-diphosphocytidyl-2-C-methyl-D-erythritol kinase
MRAAAYAKINIALAVHSVTADGFHSLRGLFQSVSLFDTIEIERASSDSVIVSNGEAPANETNLGWLALDAVRRATRVSTPTRLSITKRIPSGAGLGGGSADAAAVIGLFAQTGAIDEELAMEIAASLGSDVPFALNGGTALVRGRGEMVDPVEPLDGFALALVVPPFSLSTRDVFQEWDRLGGPVGDPVADSRLPPTLRGMEPIRNDLFPAALSLDPRIGEWRDELTTLWGTTVCMTGSGSGLFGFFSSIDEATDATNAVSMPVRAAEALNLMDRGWNKLDD